MADQTVDEYIASLDGWQAEVVSTLRQIIRQAAPKATAAIKWGRPVYEENGPCCYIKAHKHHVNFGFWRGAELADPLGLLEGTGEKMRHVKLSGVADIRPEALQGLIRSAVRPNQAQGDPTESR